MKKSKGTSVMRTKSGKPSAAARKKSGTKSGPKKGSFPIFDKKSSILYSYILYNSIPLTSCQK